MIPTATVPVQYYSVTVKGAQYTEQPIRFSSWYRDAPHNLILCFQAEDVDTVSQEQRQVTRADRKG